MLRSVLAVCLLLLMSLARAETAVPVRVATTTLQPLVEAAPGLEIRTRSRVVRAAPEFADAHFNLATLLEETGNHDGAL